MLDEKVVVLARKTAAARLKDLDEPLARDIGAIKAKMRGYGTMWLYLMERYQQEMVTRADIVWRNLIRAHQSTGAHFADGLRGHLIQAFRADLDAVVTALAPRFQEDFRNATQSSKERSWNAKLGDARDHELARYEAEADHYVALLETAEAHGGTPSNTPRHLGCAGTCADATAL
jgi:hypothetical protein